jgi:hypothetical protein
MKTRHKLLVLFLLLAGLAVAGCGPTGGGPCTFTANVEMTAYRLPDASSDVFGAMGAGESFEALARTADGWVGFDPGVAQAGNQGLARHRWVQDSVTFSPSCVDGVDLVTLADVEADLP